MAKRTARPSQCNHQHLRFNSWGQLIQCIDCERQWRLETPQGLPDATYQNPSLSRYATRHDRFATPRDVKAAG